MNLIIADAAVALVPKSWETEQSINSYIEKRKRRPIIDGSKHQHLLKNIPLSERKDRPDILHFALLTALGYTELIPEMSIYFSTSSSWYSIDRETRLPRAQNRFYGILEQILAGKSNNPYIQNISPVNLDLEKTVFFSSKGREMAISDLQMKNYVFGGFAHGDFSSFSPPKSQTVQLVSTSLDAWTAISLFLNKYLHSIV